MKFAATCASVLAVGLLVLGGCDTERPGPTVEKIENNPLDYSGKRVTVNGEVDDVFSARAFELESDDDPFEIFEEDLLVVSRSPMSFSGGALEDDDKVVVTGTVKWFVIADLERDVGWDLGPELETQFADEAIIVAESITRIENQSNWSESSEEPTAAR